MNKSNNTHVPAWVPGIAAAAILWAVLTFTESAQLRKIEDLSLFLFDWNFLNDSFAIPGGFLGWVGSFFTQFLHVPWLGALIWVTMLYAATALTKRIMCIPDRLCIMAAIPVTLLIIGNMSVGYGLFIMRIQEHFFAPTLGYLMILAIIASVRKTGPLWLKIALLTIWAVIGYPLAGVFALAGTFAAGIDVLVPEYSQDSVGTERKQITPRIATCITGVALSVIVPILLFAFYTRYRMTDSWTMGLPTTSDSAWTVPIRIPYYILLGVTPVMVLCKRLFNKSSDRQRTFVVTQSFTAVLLLAFITVFWYSDSNFKAELSMSLAVDDADWQKVTGIYTDISRRNVEKEKRAYEKRKAELSGVNNQDEINNILDKYDKKFFEPTRLMVLFRDLALVGQDKALDQAFTMRDGGRAQNSRAQIPMAFQAGRQLYFNYGLVNLCYRWCLEDQVEHGWCYGTFKYMAMHAVLMHETEFAEKYLNKLDKTLFYRKWAGQQRILAADSSLMAQSAQYKDILPLMCFDDRMSNDRVKVETYLMKHFVEDRDAQATPQFDRVSLLWAMRTQNIDMFWKALFQYLNTNDPQNLPRSVQEAMILYDSLEGDQSGFPIDKKVKDSYDSFMKYVSNSSFHSEKEASFQYWQKFGTTFYYYYYFIRNLQTF